MLPAIALNFPACLGIYHRPEPLPPQYFDAWTVICTLQQCLEGLSVLDNVAEIGCLHVIGIETN